jgi:hypothetical protein
MAERSTRGAFAACFENKRLWLIQFFANPILCVMYAAWLLIPEARTWELTVNAVLALVIVVLAVVLHAGTLNYFCGLSRGEAAELTPAFSRALRNIIAVAVWIVVFYLALRLWGRLDQYQDSMCTYFRSMLPAFLRRHITLRAVIRIFEIKMFILRWIVTPGILLPLAAQAADRGFGGFGKSGWAALKSAVKSIRYWATIILAAVVGVHVSSHLLNWHSHSQNSTFAGETTSLVLRFLLAYLLGLFSWMLVCSAVGRICGIREDARGNSTP